VSKDKASDRAKLLGFSARQSRLTTSKTWTDAVLADAPLYPSGFELFRQDTPAHAVYFSNSGLVKLMRSEDNGRELILSLKFSGSLLGAAAVINREPYPFSAVAVTKCRLARLRAGDFLELVSSDQQLAACLNEELSAEILAQTARLSQIACLSARQRLENLLWQLACDESLKSNRSEIRFQLPLRHWEAAQLLAITPTYLSKLLTELEYEEIITRTKGWFVIRRPNKLWRGPSP
jgi:CRP/FNR family transcriptional regulator